jgi:hypothetical protein
MTGSEWKQLRKRYGTQEDVALALRTPLRTVQGWESSKRVKGVVVSSLLLLLNDTERLREKILADMAARLDREFPNGIPSEAVRSVE